MVETKESKEPIDGIMHRTLVTITCPACGETLQATAYDGKVKGYCAKANKRVEVIAK